MIVRCTTSAAWLLVLIFLFLSTAAEARSKQPSQTPVQREAERMFISMFGSELHRKSAVEQLLAPDTRLLVWRDTLLDWLHSPDLANPPADLLIYLGHHIERIEPSERAMALDRVALALLAAVRDYGPIAAEATRGLDALAKAVIDGVAATSKPTNEPLQASLHTMYSTWLMGMRPVSVWRALATMRVVSFYTVLRTPGVAEALFGKRAGETLAYLDANEDALVYEPLAELAIEQEDHELRRTLADLYISYTLKFSVDPARALTRVEVMRHASEAAAALAWSTRMALGDEAEPSALCAVLESFKAEGPGASARPEEATTYYLYSALAAMQVKEPIETARGWVYEAARVAGDMHLGARPARDAPATGVLESLDDMAQQCRVKVAPAAIEQFVDGIFTTVELGYLTRVRDAAQRCFFKAPAPGFPVVRAPAEGAVAAAPLATADDWLALAASATATVAAYDRPTRLAPSFVHALAKEAAARVAMTESPSSVAALETMLGVLGVRDPRDVVTCWRTGVCEGGMTTLEVAEAGLRSVPGGSILAELAGRFTLPCVPDGGEAMCRTYALPPGTYRVTLKKTETLSIQLSRTRWQANHLRCEVDAEMRCAEVPASSPPTPRIGAAL